MRDSVQYLMRGFNRQLPQCENKWEMTLTDIKPYLYENHPFLHSVSIDEHITHITFELKEGMSCKDHIKEIGYELEKITFNIISRYPNLPIDKPLCFIEAAIHNGKDITEGSLHEYLFMGEDLSIMRQEPIERIYEMALSNNVAIKEKAEKYQELFCLLQCSDRVIQYLGLYDIMSDLISKLYIKQHKSIQERVCMFFGINGSRYPEVKFYTSNKSQNIKEDSYTHLRNDIAHSMQIGIGKFLEVAQGINFQHIQGMLVVINDLLCENVTV